MTYRAAAIGLCLSASLLAALDLGEVLLHPDRMVDERRSRAHLRNPGLHAVSEFHRRGKVRAAFQPSSWSWT